MTDATGPLAGLEERVLERRGARLRAFVGGEGPPLLLVHGYAGASWNFGELAPLLLGSRRLLIPDLPGHGGSTPLPAATLAAFADLLAALCDEERVERLDVFGHSMGGVVALRLAARHPGRVRRLVLAASAGIGSATRVSEVLITLAGIVQPGRLVGRHPQLVARHGRLRRAIFQPWSVADADRLDGRAVEGLLRGPPLHTDALAAGRALVADDPRRELHRIEAPVLCLWGARDLQVPLEDAFEYARRLRAPLRVIADCGHLLIVERPDACAAAVGEFLS